ncbi:hypothetical protein FRB96_008504 [Tulasnella sp. 330]|nr:hypothetical protein FRB96_008504 [Tulasnella sp. 330]
MQGRYPEAQAAYQKASDMYGELGARQGMANCLIWLGKVHRMQGRYPDAQVAYQKASDVQLHRLQAQYSDAHKAFSGAKITFEELGSVHKAAYCSEVLDSIPAGILASTPHLP